MQRKGGSTVTDFGRPCPLHSRALPEPRLRAKTRAPTNGSAQKHPPSHPCAFVFPICDRGSLVRVVTRVNGLGIRPFPSSLVLTGTPVYCSALRPLRGALAGFDFFSHTM
jgi:hypothetical protein